VAIRSVIAAPSAMEAGAEGLASHPFVGQHLAGESQSVAAVGVG